MLYTVKPNLFIVGAPKAGTTAIATYLAAHPNVFFSDPKEPNFFCSDFSDSFRAFTELKSYLELFKKVKDEQVIAEGSVTYLFSKTAVPNILQFNPASKFLICLRNPVDLVISMHRQQINNMEEDVEDFSYAWNLQQKRRMGLSLPAQNRDHKLLLYREWGLLGQQVDRFLTLVPKLQCHFILFEDIKLQPKAVYQELLEFLELQNDGRSEFDVVNSAFRWRNKSLVKFLRFRPPLLGELSDLTKKLNHGRPLGVYRRLEKLIDKYNRKSEPLKPLCNDIKRMLIDDFSEDINLLEHLIERKLDHWKKMS